MKRRKVIDDFKQNLKKLNNVLEAYDDYHRNSDTYKKEMEWAYLEVGKILTELLYTSDIRLLGVFLTGWATAQE